MQQLVLIAHNVRSAHNVGSLLRTAEGLGVQQVYLTGYTPYPAMPDDTRLPHSAAKQTRDIHKTALGAETAGLCQHMPDVFAALSSLHAQGFTIAALEQTADAQPLPQYQPPDKLAILVGREVEGVEPEVLAQTDLRLVIPMFGRKESFNVAQAAAMALYHCKFA